MHHKKINLVHVSFRVVPEIPSPQTQGGGWGWEREVGSAGVGWSDEEKRHTTVIE